MVTAEQFATLFPRNPEPAAWAEALNAVLPGYGIDTPLRLAAFLAQCGHESIGFTHLVEGLNYRAEALTATWPKRFPASIAAQYAHHPEAIANRAYADRLGNGPEESGDGWKHRGRGVIQITGRDAYREFARVAGKSYDDIFSYLETKAGAIESACWYWTTRNLNQLADSSNVTTMTRAINGGLNGLDDRKTRYAQACNLLVG